MSLLALLLLPACGSGASPEAEVPADEAPRPIVLTEVRLTTMSVARPFSHDAELRGLVTAAIELGLSDLPGVVPVVPGDAAALSFLGERPPPHRQVDARLSARGAPEALEFELELCVAGGGCLSTTSTGTAKDPWAAVGDMLDGAASVLDVEVSDEARAAWRKPGSKDNYSELITGRAAAQFYGILPPSLTPGDPRNDPVRKAVFLDPGQPLAQWIRARWEAATTVDGGKAADALGRAQLLRPTPHRPAVQAQPDSHLHFYPHLHAHLHPDLHPHFHPNRHIYAHPDLYRNAHFHQHASSQRYPCPQPHPQTAHQNTL